MVSKTYVSPIHSSSFRNRYIQSIGSWENVHIKLTQYSTELQCRSFLYKGSSFCLYYDIVKEANNSIKTEGPSWSWSYGSWINNFQCNQWLSPLMLFVWIPLRQGVLDTTLCDKVCQWLATDLWFSPPIKLTATI